MEINLIQHLNDFNRRMEEKSDEYKYPFTPKERISKKDCNCEYDKNKQSGYCITCNGWV